MFADMRHELRSVLDDRLIASARMVAGIVHQFKPHNASPEDWGPMLNVVARDGVACEVSMIRSEVQTAPRLAPWRRPLMPRLAEPRARRMRARP